MSFLIRTIPFLLLLGAIPLGYYASRCGVTPSCSLVYILHDFSFTVFKPLWVFSLYALAGTILVPFFSRHVFKIWLRFAVIWIVLTILLVAWAPETMNAWFYVISHTKSDVARWMGMAFTTISIPLLGITALALYKPSKKR